MSLAVLIGTIALSITWVSNAHTGFDPLHTIKVETVATDAAYPKDVHVKVTDKSVVVSGIIRRTRHNSIRLRGYVNVSMLDSNGAIIESERRKIFNGHTKVHRIQYSRFKVILPLPKAKSYSIRVSHVKK